MRGGDSLLDGATSAFHRKRIEKFQHPADFHGMLLNMGLVLEGGGMRGVFTSGALDCLLDNSIKFPYVIGVSAGASNGLSFVSEQRGRGRFCNIDALVKYRYIGIKYLFSQRCIMDYKFLFGDLPVRIYPYDFDTYMRSGRFVFVATNCLSGLPEYIEKPATLPRLLDVCKASCSLPFLCPPVKIDSTPMLDGGITDAIPLQRAIADGYKKNVLILTRNYGYRKKAEFKHLPFFVYAKYPNLRNALADKSDLYNTSMDSIERLEKEKKVVVIRPRKRTVTGRLSTDIPALESLYEEGYRCASEAIDDILKINP